MAKTIRLSADQHAVFATGLDQIRAENKVPTSFPADVLAAADAAAHKEFTAEHVDRTDVAFVTLDPLSSTDLDQAFALEAGPTTSSHAYARSTSRRSRSWRQPRKSRRPCVTWSRN